MHSFPQGISRNFIENPCSALVKWSLIKSPPEKALKVIKAGLTCLWNFLKSCLPDLSLPEVSKVDTTSELNKLKPLLKSINIT